MAACIECAAISGHSFSYLYEKLRLRISSDAYNEFGRDPIGEQVPKLLARIQNDTKFGSHFEKEFLVSLTNIELALSSEVVQIKQNYLEGGYDIYIYIKPLDAYIAIELKNWRTHYRHTPTMFQENYWNKMQSNHPSDISNKKIIHRFLILAGDNATPNARFDLERDSSTTFISSKYWFDENPTPEQIEDNKNLLEDAQRKIIRYINSLIDALKESFFDSRVSIWLEKKGCHHQRTEVGTISVQNGHSTTNYAQDSDLLSPT